MTVPLVSLTGTVSAGFDAAAGDPLGECKVTPAGFAHMTHQLSSLAGGKLVLALEGGYDLPAISHSAVECIRVLLGDDPPPIGPLVCQDAAADAVEASVRALSPYWKSLRPTSEHLDGAPRRDSLLTSTALRSRAQAQPLDRACDW